MRLGPLDTSPLDALLVFIPVSAVLEVSHAPPVWVFASSGLAIVPLAGWMGRATEHLAAHFGAGIGGLLNATFGNAAELIIAIFALRGGLHDVVKASLAGSIIGNVLLVLGLGLLLGGLRHPRQRFNPTAAGIGSTLLALSAIGLVVPAIFHWLTRHVADPPEQNLSLAISVVLFGTYALSLLFSLRTHRHLFAGEGGEPHGNGWSRRRAIITLLVATALVALMSEFLVGAVEPTAEAFGLSSVFIGVVLVAIVGNAAEHSSAVLLAMKNKVDVTINIAVGSGIQVALLVTPLLVFLSYAIDPGHPMDLLFTPMEVVAVGLSVLVVSLIAHDGESHWMEGVLLLAVYVVLGIAFFYLP